MLTWSVPGTTAGPVLVVHAILFLTRQLLPPSADDISRW